MGTHFKVLGFFIDNKLERLNENYHSINSKEESIINKWRPYYLSVHGRVTIAKSMLLSQYTYMGMIMDILDPDDLKHIQNLLNYFKIHNQIYKNCR